VCSRLELIEGKKRTPHKEQFLYPVFEKKILSIREKVLSIKKGFVDNPDIVDLIVKMFEEEVKVCSSSFLFFRKRNNVTVVLTTNPKKIILAKFASLIRLLCSCEFSRLLNTQI
jgi:hypothetical protein